MTYSRWLVTLGVGCSLVSVCSCAADERQAQPGRVSNDPAAAHAVHSRELHAIMSKLGRTSRKRWPQEIESERAADAEAARAERFEVARQLSDAMSQAASQIPQAIANVQLEPAERERFLAEVQRLKTQAGELEAAATRHDFEAMRATLKSVRTTCNGCHSQFSDLTGPIKLPASAL